MKKQMDMDALRNLESMQLDEARAVAKSQLSMKKSSTKFHHILRDLDNAKSSKEVSRIMWNVMLAGEGFAMPGSDWQKLHKITG